MRDSLRSDWHKAEQWFKVDGTEADRYGEKGSFSADGIIKHDDGTKTSVEVKTEEAVFSGAHRDHTGLMPVAKVSTIGCIKALLQRLPGFAQSLERYPHALIQTPVRQVVTGVVLSRQSGDRKRLPYAVAMPLVYGLDFLALNGFDAPTPRRAYALENDTDLDAAVDWIQTEIVPWLSRRRSIADLLRSSDAPQKVLIALRAEKAPRQGFRRSQITPLLDRALLLIALGESSDALEIIEAVLTQHATEVSIATPEPQIDQSDVKKAKELRRLADSGAAAIAKFMAHNEERSAEAIGLPLNAFARLADDT